MKNTVQFSAGIEKIQTMSDRSLQIRLSTPELPIAQMSHLFQLRDSCMVAIAPIGEEIDKFDPATLDIPKEKSPAKRLRAVLYRVWEKDKQGYSSFEQYYPIKMNELINHFKDKLD